MCTLPYPSDLSDAEWEILRPLFTRARQAGHRQVLNAVEEFFAKLTRQRLKRGIFHSLVALHAAIKRYLAETNDHPRPFQWTKDPHKIIAAVRRGHQALDSIH